MDNSELPLISRSTSLKTYIGQDEKRREGLTVFGTDADCNTKWEDFIYGLAIFGIYLASHPVVYQIHSAASAV